MTRGSDLARLTGLALAEFGRDLAARPRTALLWLRPRLSVPTRLLFAPQDLRTADPTVAQDIYAGHFVFAGRAVQTGGRSPFTVEPPIAAWSEGLYGFGWLRHLRAANTQLARENGRALVTEFLTSRRRAPAVARSTRVAGRRLIAFLTQSPLVLAGADHVFYKRFMRAIGMSVGELERGVRSSPRPLDRLLAAIALSYAALCCSGLEARLRRATRALSTELDAQILPDGGHVGRNPATVIDLLLDLLPLRQVYVSRGVEVPPALSGAIDRMLPTLRLFRHGDGELALFNGMGRTAPNNLATLASYDDVRGEPAQHATHSGYDRLTAGDAVVVVDTGPAPPLRSSASAGAGALSFELSSGPQRIVVNCGAPPAPGPLREAARATAAHSTLEWGEASSADVLPNDPSGLGGALARWLEARLGRVVLTGPGSVKAERGTDDEGATVLAASHDGYARRFGATHERRFVLGPDGARLDGTDRLVPTASGGMASGGTARETAPVRLRFHLHPSVEPAPGPDDATVLLRFRAGAEWRFTLLAGDGVVTIEDSVFFAHAEGRRTSRQIVVTAGDGTAILRWRFERVGSA